MSNVQDTMNPAAAGTCCDVRAATRRYWMLLLAIVALGVLLRLYHFRLTIGCDDKLYLIASQTLGETPQTDVSPLFYARIVWRCVLAAWGSVAGFSLQSSAVLMFLLGGCTTCLVAEFGRRAFGPGAGLLAGLFYATQPLCVLFDVLTLPDNLAVALLAASLLLFLEYLKRGTLALLLPAAFLVGLLFSVKDYYVLAAVPMGLVILGRPAGWPQRTRHAALFSVCCAAGIGVDFLLHLVFSGDAWVHLTASSNYTERKLVFTGESQPDNLLRAVHGLFWERVRYLKWLFDEYAGITDGVLMLWGACFLGWKFRARLDCRLLALCAVVFLGFLMFMPTSFRPLVLVEMQPRYLTVLLPALCIGAGAAVAGAWGTMTNTAVRRSAAAALFVGVCYSAVVPNDRIDHHRVQEFRGIRQVLEEASDLGVTELVLPTPYDLFLPDPYYTYGVEFRYRDAADEEAMQSLPDYLDEKPGRAAFLPERPFPKTDVYDKLRQSLQRGGYDVREVSVPRSTYRSWLRRLDLIDAEDQLVGWVARSARHEAEPSAGDDPRAPASPSE